MRITKEGNLEKARIYEEKTHIKKFKCHVCDCEWEYDNREAGFDKAVKLMAMEYNGLEYVSDCPCCGKKDVIAV